MIGYGEHEDCALCGSCARHLLPEDVWPCLDCGRPLCGSCECPSLHVVEVCS